MSVQERNGSLSWRASRDFGSLATGLTVFMLAACGSDGTPASTPPPADSAARTARRTCETAAHGSAPAFHRLTTASPAAAIAFVGVPTELRDPRYYEPLGDGRFRPVKVLVGVATGSTVTVVVPEPGRGRVALLYERPQPDSADGSYTMAEGEVEVSFEACDDPDTGFPGYFLLAGPRCVELDVHLGDEVERVVLPFGVDDCS